jgi:hypothetical protein
MSKFKVQGKPKIKRETNFVIGSFVIDLKFACLPCTSTVQGLPDRQGF